MANPPDTPVVVKRPIQPIQTVQIVQIVLEQTKTSKWQWQSQMAVQVTMIANTETRTTSPSISPRILQVLLVLQLVGSRYVPFPSPTYLNKPSLTYLFKYQPDEEEPRFPIHYDHRALHSPRRELALTPDNINGPGVVKGIAGKCVTLVGKLFRPVWK